MSHFPNRLVKDSDESGDLQLLRIPGPAELLNVMILCPALRGRHVTANLPVKRAPKMSKK